jgi:hypothetical protein
MRPATATSTGNSPPRRCRRRFSGAVSGDGHFLPPGSRSGGWAGGLALPDAPGTAIAGRAPSAGGGQFWLVLAGDAAVDGGDPLLANFCIFVGPEEPAFAGALGPVGAELLCLQFRRRARD